MISTHPVHADAWRRRRRADVQPPNRRGVPTPRRTRDELSEIADAGANISSNEIRVAPFEIGRFHDRSGEHTIAKTGREAFDLPLDVRHHVNVRAMRDVTIRPRNVPPLRRPRGVELC